MAIFGTKDKQGNPSINLMMVDGISSISKGLAVNVTLFDNNLQIKVRIGKNAPANLSYSQITNVDYMSEKEVAEKSKSVIGRAVAGGLIFGGLGAIIGGMSGTGSNQINTTRIYLIVNYIPSIGGDIKAISFEVVGATLGLEKFTKELRDRCGILPILSDPVNL